MEGLSLFEKLSKSKILNDRVDSKMMKAGKDVESSNPVPSEFKTEEIET